MGGKKKLYNLKRPKLRQSWNKYNLYNIWRQREPAIGLNDLTSETFFQQKWRARGLLRAYHGEHIKERDWNRMFSRRLLGVAGMNQRYMAKYDGSELAAGRGSGKDVEPDRSAWQVKPRVITPYMNMTFAPMERRLDIAVFRAMFASSTRQARQFCIHGAVKVNGKVMHHPMYLLNPGDMFQVDPEKVMYATGLPNPAGRKARNPNKPRGERRVRRAPRAPKPAEAEGESKAQAEAESSEGAEGEAAVEQDPDTTDKPEVKANMEPTRTQIQYSLKLAKQALAATSKKRVLGVSHKRALRAFMKDGKKLLSRASRKDVKPTDIANELTEMLRALPALPSAVTSPTLAAAESDRAADADKEESQSPKAAPQSIDDLTAEERKILERLIREEEENPLQPDKPYLTPWKPRKYMSPFAFIPRYLEVNQNICAAVYLRHPVARNGSAEVPTPFGYRVQQLAFNWYLRRR